MAKVSIITRTKDRPVFLKRAINSIYSQTFSDFELAIINDGGDKASVEGAIGELTDDQRSKLTVYHRDTPSNAPDTIFNESIDRTAAEYVVIHDDDDTWHPEFLQYAVDRLDLGVKGVVARTDKVTEEVHDEVIRRIKSEPYMPDVKVINLYRQCIDNQMTPIAFVYRRDAYIEVGKYDSSLPVVGDWEFGIRFLMKYDIDFIDPGFALAYYHHRKSAPSIKNRDNSFAKHDHRYHTNRVINKYLRAELADGRLGVGYIMSKLKYDQGNVARMAKGVMPKFIVNRIKRRIS